MLLKPDSQLLSNMSGKTKILHSIQGGVGKSYIMKLFEDGINAVNDDIKYGSEGCEFGCIRMQAAGDISNMANLIFKKWLRVDKDDKGNGTWIAREVILQHVHNHQLYINTLSHVDHSPTWICDL